MGSQASIEAVPVDPVRADPAAEARHDLVLAEGFGVRRAALTEGLAGWMQGVGVLPGGWGQGE